MPPRKEAISPIKKTAVAAAPKKKKRKKTKGKGPNKDSSTYPFYEGYCISAEEIERRKGTYEIGIDIGEVNFGVCALPIEGDPEILAIGVVNLRAVHPYYSNPNAKKRPLTRYEIPESILYTVEKSKSMSALFKNANKIIVETQGSFDEGGPVNGWVEVSLLTALRGRGVHMSSTQSKKALPHIFFTDDRPKRGSVYQMNAYNKRCIESVPAKFPFTDTANAKLELISSNRRHHALDAWLMAMCKRIIRKYVQKRGSFVTI